MNDLDIYYRALRAYRAVTQENRNCVNFSQAIAHSNAEQDQIVITRNICTVEEDWIQAIEEGLVYVEKAIREERQFIHSEGEVLEIEKVKHFSSESVRHLARHSNLITQEQTGDDIIPDKLYSVERLSDYTVYENRFLYMLLCYLRDFVTLRYNQILDLSNKYDGVIRLEKQLDLPKQKMSCTISLHDERRDDSFLREHNSAQQIIDRIDLILKAILSFLATPLMEITGKAPMLKPPITKTNVLKMDNNFRGAVRLYDFIISYDKPGYTVINHRAEHSPLPDGLAAEMSDAIALLSFLTYSHGLDLQPILKNEYEIEQSKRAQQEQEKMQEHLHTLKRRLSAMEISPEEYIVALEQQNKLLEKESRKTEPLRAQLQQLTDTNALLNVQLEASRIEAKTAQEKLETIEQTLRDEFDTVRADYDERIHQMILDHEAQISALEQEMRQRIDALNAQLQDTIQGLRGQLTDANSQLASSQAHAEQLLQQFEALNEQRNLCLAQIKALRLQQGSPAGEEDFTEKEQFEQLEKEFEAFAKFYRQNWSKTKRKIRSQLLNYKYLKGLSEQ